MSAILRYHRDCKKKSKYSRRAPPINRNAQRKRTEKWKKELQNLLVKAPSKLNEQTRWKLGVLIVKKLRFIRPIQGSKSKSLKSSSNQNDDISSNTAIEKRLAFCHEELGRAPLKREIKKRSKRVKWDEKESNILAELNIAESIRNDPCLYGNYSRDVASMINKDFLKIVVKVKFDHYRREYKKEHTLGSLRFTNELMKSNQNYSPPSSRILMIGEPNESWPIKAKIYSDLSKETTIGIDIPDSSLYRYTHRNNTNLKKYPSLSELTEDAESCTNVIKCNCCTGSVIKECWKNRDCPCYKANMQLKNALQKDKEKQADFTTFHPITIKSTDPFFDSVGFACSEACACRGRCTNNSTFLVDKEIAQLEVFRKNKELGFGVRTNTIIKAGTPLLEFTGEVEDGSLSNDDQDYAIVITDEKDNFYKEVFEKSKSFKFSKSCMKKLKLEWNKAWYLNPKRIGNIARTVCHSCEPNMVMVRVFQKGFSPAHCRLILVTLDVVFPGEELTFDYGPVYVEKNLRNECLCKRPSCRSSRAFSSLAKASFRSLEEYEALKYHLRYTQFKYNVMDPIKARFPNL